MVNEEELERTSEFWGSDSGQWRTEKWEHWLQHPKVQQRLNVLTTGSLHKDRYANFVDRFFRAPSGVVQQFDRGITLGCGYGEFERGLSQYGLLRVHEAVDISRESIARARHLAQSEGFTHIQYRIEDLNRISLPVSSYDVVFGISSIHHVTDLKHLFQQVAASLKSGGYFLLDEYVGPSQFQWPDEQLSAINEQLEALPAEFKLLVNGKGPKGAVVRPTLAQMNAEDPSEAIRSADILKLVSDYFDVVEVKGYGGSLLHMLLAGITGNFVEDDPRSMAYLQGFFDLEDSLIASGRLQHDFANIIVRKKRGALP
jgi:SAM-dependent methyltransferase